MELTGKLIKKLHESQGVGQKSGQPWRAAEYLFEIAGVYTRHIVFKLLDGQYNRIARFDSLMGKEVTVNFDIDAHESAGRWYNDINAWGIVERNEEKSETQQSSFEELKEKDAVAAQAVKLNETKEHGTDTEELPF